MKFSAVFLLTAFALGSSAFTEPDVTKEPSGNSIAKPSLAEQVPAGEAYTVTWQPTTPGKVSIQLLRGPSTNVKPIALIADAIDNTGSFQWTPPTSLENDVTHYGLRLVVEGTGQYQYSTQFGIKNDNKPSEPTASSTSASSTTATTSTPVAQTSSSGENEGVCVIATEAPSETTSQASSIAATSSKTKTYVATGTGILPPPSGPTAALPTSLSVVPTPTPSAPATSSPPPFANAGSQNVATMGAAIAAFFAVLAF